MLLSGRSDTLKQESRQIELPPKPEELSIETRRFPVGIPNKTAKTARQESVLSETDEEQKEPPVVGVDQASEAQAMVSTDLGESDAGIAGTAFYDEGVAIDLAGL